MLNSRNFKKITTTTLLAILMQAAATNYGVAQTPTDKIAGSLNHNLYERTLEVNNTVSLERTVTINSIPDIINETTTTTATKIDVLFLADNTSSMTDAIKNVQDNALSLLDTLSKTYGDVEFGVARYYGDPQEKTGERETVCVKSNSRGQCTKQEDRYPTFGAMGAYQLQEAVNGGTKADAIAAINRWQSGSANTDWQEGNFFALHQAATNGATVGGYGTNYNTGWRSDAKKVIVWFGDAFSHEDTINKARTIEALKKENITVVAINADTKTYKYYGYYLSSIQGLDYNLQASSIATATDGKFAVADPDKLASTMKTLIGEAVTKTTTTNSNAGTVDLQFETVGQVSSDELVISYECTDSKGCKNVKAGESRKFKMNIEGKILGTYNFNTVVTGVNGALATNNVRVACNNDGNNGHGNEPAVSFTIDNNTLEVSGKFDLSNPGNSLKNKVSIVNKNNNKKIEYNSLSDSQKREFREKLTQRVCTFAD